MIVPGKPQPTAIPLSGDLAVSPRRVRVQGIGSLSKFHIPKPSCSLHQTPEGQGVPVTPLAPATGAESIPDASSKGKRGEHDQLLWREGEDGDFGGLHHSEGGCGCPPQACGKQRLHLPLITPSLHIRCLCTFCT